MIKRLFPDQVYNPIREHIQMSFEIVNDTKEMVEKITENLIDQDFDPEKSRVLIFSPTRKGTEKAVTELKATLGEYEATYKEKVDYYHAGLDGITREEKYEDYKSGKVVILIATKAFGMGMDIKNIHFLYHLGPSSTFEDYLQEVGRAGRDENMLFKAGYSKENPLQSICLLTGEDFKKLKDRFHKNQITWNQIEQVLMSIFEYYSKFRKLEPDLENAFPLPLDLLNQLPEYEDIYDKDTFFRVVLYWLEKLNKIKLGVYTPTFLPIKILNEEFDFRFIDSAEDREVLVNLREFLIKFRSDKFPGSDVVMIDMTSLRGHLEVKSSTEIYKILFRAQRARLIAVDRFIKLQPTKLRTEELNRWTDSTKSPMIEATFEFAQELVDLSALGDQVNLENEEIELIFKNNLFKHFRPAYIFWREVKNEKRNEYFTNMEIAEKLQEDFIKKRSKFAFKSLSFLPKIRHKSILETDNHDQKPKVTQLLYNGYKSHQEPKEEMRVFQDDLYRLIYSVSKRYIKENEYEFNIVDLINDLGLTDKSEEYFQNLVFISKGLGYLKGSGSLVPMGVEMKILDITDIQGDVVSSSDYSIKQEFVESSKMKELRLMALECLTDIKKSEYDQYIKSYFKCGSLGDLIALLEDYIGDDDLRLKGFREEALNDEKERLNESQRKVFDSDIRRNIQVAAGPGTGKTHTLTLRVARLIQEEKISPETILILAYNRSVVVELKDRLRTIFKALGYSKLISRLKVFTFHGFIKYCISQQIQDLEFKEWTSTFLTTMRNAPGLITQKLGPIKYVFVDEFQDITSERMELLQVIANPNRTKVCVIGDPNQSIYGYERANSGDSMAPQPFYEAFKNIYNPLERSLDINYRSYPKILETADSLLNLNQTKFELPKLTAFKHPNIEHDYCEIIDVEKIRFHWKDKLKELIQFENQGKRYGQIAIMFRSNNEVFKAYNEIRGLSLKNIRIRIQGSKGALFKSREFYHLISELEKKGSVVLTNEFLNEIERIKDQTINRFPKWDQYLLNIFHCLAYEFEKERDDYYTYEDFILFVKDISSKDDGQYGKIYQQNINQITKNKFQDQEIVLTTMHKVKGLEFDAVLIPPSFTNLPAFENEASLVENIEEERRLYYVAYTRAKYRLTVFWYQRELSLLRGEEYSIPANQERQLGIPVKEGLDKFKMFWSAGNYGGNSFEFLRDSVSIGDPLTLEQEYRGGCFFWHVFVRNIKVAQLSTQMVATIEHLNQVKGFSVSSIYVHKYEETLESDAKNGTSYALNWTEEARKRGFIYLLDFSGYGKVNI